MFSWESYYSGNEGQKVRLNLGAGPYFVRRGWTSVDKISEDAAHYGTVQSQVTSDLTQSSSLRYASVAMVYASHFFEHLTCTDASALMTRVFQSMQPGARMRLVVPDADLILNRYLERDHEFFRPIDPILRSDGLELTLDNYALVILAQKLADRPEAIQMLRSVSSQSKTEVLMALNKLSDKEKNNDEGRFHLMAYNFEILRDMLEKAGFKSIERSYFMGSRSPEMREVPLFDSTHPWMSLYVEAVR